MSRRRATLREVAEAAGVSVGTVSNVVTGRRPVRPETRAAVEAAVARLGYRPDAAARTLIARRVRPEPPLSPTTPRLTCIGYVCADHRAEVDVLPHRDDRSLAASIDQRLGGRAANVAVSAAGLGPPIDVATELLTVMGHDADSDWAARLLTERRVRLHPASRLDAARLSRCIIMVEPGGQRTILNEPLQVAPETVARWLAADPEHTAPHAVYVQGDQLGVLGPSLDDRLGARWLVTQLVRVDIEALGSETVRQLVERFHCVVFDAEAARALVGSSGGTRALVERLAAWTAGVSTLVALTLGADGAVLVRDGVSVAHAAAPAIEPVDTTGAGDTFTGVLTALLLHGQAGEAALSGAVSAASRSVLRTGAQDHGLTASAIGI